MTNLGIEEPKYTNGSRTRKKVLRRHNTKFDFVCYETQGTSVYRVPQGAAWPPQSLEDCRTVGVPENLVRVKGDLAVGDELLVPSFIGLNIGVVAFHSHDGHPYAVSPSGNMMFMLTWNEAQHPDGLGARWVCSGSANIKALKKLKSSA